MVIHVIRAGPDNPETSLAAKLYFTFKFSPSRHTRISSRNDSHLAAFPFQVGMCLRSPEPASAAILLLQSVGCKFRCRRRCRRRSGDDQFCSSPLSRERMRLAETNRIRLQIEQLRYHCESIDPLDDTCDARCLSLISGTMRHVFDSQNQRDT